MQSHPSWVRGLKLGYRPYQKAEDKSHPSWVRGLKLKLLILFLFHKLSHPSWVRGLKLNYPKELAIRQSRTPRGCVD